MTDHHFHWFETAIGRCAILWRDGAITGVLLPAASDEAMKRSILRRASEAKDAPPPAFVSAAIERIKALCRGERVDFADAPLDRAAIEPFANRVYDILVRVPFGATTTYGAIAEELGDKSRAQAVGAALGANPFPIVIPCHRVIGAEGKLGGFSAPGGTDAKRRLLEIEGAFAAEKLPLFRNQ